MTYYKLCNNFRLQSSFGVDWGCKNGKKKTHGQVILRNYYYWMAICSDIHSSLIFGHIKVSSKNIWLLVFKNIKVNNTFINVANVLPDYFKR